MHVLVYSADYAFRPLHVSYGYLGDPWDVANEFAEKYAEVMEFEHYDAVTFSSMEELNKFLVDNSTKNSELGNMLKGATKTMTFKELFIDPILAIKGGGLMGVSPVKKGTR